jgi:hypothetical protein
MSGLLQIKWGINDANECKWQALMACRKRRKRRIRERKRNIFEKEGI